MKKRVFLLVLSLTVAILNLIGQQTRGSISGTVTDKNGDPLPAAHVIIDSLHTGVTTDNRGFYTIHGLRYGDYKVQFSFVGYNPETRLVELDGEAVCDVMLSEATFVTDEIVIRATRAGERTPMANTTVDASLLKRSDLTRDIPFLLSMTPSVVEISDAGNGIGYTSVRIRGTDASRINVTIDGIPLNDAESQQVFWVDLPDLASSSGAIQVQRGVGTSTNGSGAFGASMNISTMSIPEYPGAGVDLSAGSFSTWRVMAKAWSGLCNDRFNMMIRASSIGSDGYIEHSSSRIKSVMVSTNWITPRSKLRFNFLSGNERTGISWWGVPLDTLPVNRRFNPAGIYEDAGGKIRYYEDETDNYLQNHYHLFYTRSVTGKLTLNAGLHFTDGSGYYEEQKSDRDPEEYGLGTIMSGDELVTETDLVQRKWMGNNFYGLIWSLVSKGKRTEWITGGGANRYDGDHFGRLVWMQFPGNFIPGYEWYRNRGLKDEFNIYSKLNSSVSDRVNAFIDIQYRYIGYTLTGNDDDMRDISQKHFYNFINPKFGLFWSDGGGNEAFLSASVAHREPTRSNFTDATGDNLVTPKPERLTDIEGGYSFRTAGLRLSLNLYMMLYHDQLVPTGKISNTGYPVMTNVSKSHRAGIELSGDYRPSPVAALRMNLTISRNKIPDFRNYYLNYNTSDWSSEYTWSDLGTVDIAYSPSLTGSAEMELNPAKRVSIRLNGKYVGKQYFDNTMSNARCVDPYFVSNLVTEYAVKTLNPKEVIIRLHVNNLFNTMYENNAYGGMWAEDGAEKTWAYLFPQAGINLMGGVSVTF